MARSWRRITGALAAGCGLAIAAVVIWMALKGRVADRVYTIGFESNPPYQVLESNGEMSGLAVETVREAAQRAGIRLRWVPIEGGSEDALRQRRVDLWPLMIILPHRRAILHLTEPWLELGSCLLVLESSRIRRSSDAAGARIAYRGQGIDRRRVQELWGPSRHVPLSDPTSVRDAVCSGEADAGFLDEHAAMYVMLRAEQCAGGPLRLVNAPEASITLAVASTFEAAPAADAIRREIGALARTGRLAAILNEWAFYAPRSVRSLVDLIDARRKAMQLGLAAAVMALILLVALWQAYRLRQARLSAERASESKSAFLATVSHEIRTPMSGVIGLTRMLGDTRLDSEQAELVASIRQCARSLLAIIDDVLDLSKVEAGKLELERIPFSPRAAVADVLRLLQVRAAEKGLDLTSEIHPDVPECVVADPLRLRQVLFNLVGNALKFTDRGSVKVRAGVDRRYHDRVEVWFEVEDTGPGIPRKALPALFKPYTQADGSTSRKYGGFGLGLAISRRLVEAMGGSITVTSKEGRGSTFWFVLPCGLAGSAAVPEPVAESPAAPSPSAPLRVLVAEDNVVNQRVARYFLEKLGHQVQVVSNGAEAVEACRRQKFDAILMDCQMPEVDGYEATRRIREAESAAGDPPTPIIAMTANAMQADREACLAAGMQDHLGKPVELEELARALDRWAARPQDRAALR